VPFGLRLAADGHKVEPNPAEVAVIKRVKRERAAGRTFQAILDGLIRDGVPARGAKGWHLTSVQRIARR
jgi:hypothetical protein